MPDLLSIADKNWPPSSLPMLRDELHSNCKCMHANHPRIVIGALVLMMCGFSVALDSLRTYIVINEVEVRIAARSPTDCDVVVGRVRRHLCDPLWNDHLRWLEMKLIQGGAGRHEEKIRPQAHHVGKRSAVLQFVVAQHSV